MFRWHAVLFLVLVAPLNVTNPEMARRLFNLYLAAGQLDDLLGLVETIEKTQLKEYAKSAKEDLPNREKFLQSLPTWRIRVLAKQAAKEDTQLEGSTQKRVKSELAAAGAWLY